MMMNKRMKKWLSLFFALMILLSAGTAAQARSKKKKNTPSPTPVITAQEGMAWVAQENVYLLADMHEDADRVLKLPYAARVEIVDEEQDEQGLTWCLIEYEEEIGFVSREALSDREIVPATPTKAPTPAPTAAAVTVTEDGEYTDKDHVAEYLRQFGHLPSNYIRKNEAQRLGWVSSQGNLWKVAPGKSIGGDRYGNYEGTLPDKRSRTWTECDIDFEGKYRNGKRIVFSNDGLIYYTDDHYETFVDITERTAESGW